MFFLCLQIFFFFFPFRYTNFPLHGSETGILNGLEMLNCPSVGVNCVCPDVDWRPPVAPMTLISAKQQSAVLTLKCASSIPVLCLCVKHPCFGEFGVRFDILYVHV